MVMTRDSIRSLVDEYTSAWERGARDAWLATFSVDATQEDPIGEGVRRGRAEIGRFWDQAMASYDGIEIRQRAVHITGNEAALEWTIVARDGAEWVVFDGVDVFTFTSEPLIASVRAYWQRDDRRRTTAAP